MDWFLDTTQPVGGRALRKQFAAYLARHASDDADLAAAELVFAETVANAAEHSAGAVWVSVDWSEPTPLLVVHDLGEGFTLDPRPPEDEFAESGRGLVLVSHLSTELAVAARRAGGSTVTARLPVRRPEEPSYEPPSRRVDALPTMDEASPEGTFGKESFLRALVVELAQAVEFTDGPAAIQAAIVQVGTDVGGRMEDEYRRARSIVDELTPEQMADLYVRLKNAIEGDFFVIEASAERIVLGTRSCPFGGVVQRAPALCRMTSSVFGGIAARNTGGAVVHLEERIAVGDPQCRVTVWLGAAGEGKPGHHYRSGSAATS